MTDLTPLPEMRDGSEFEVYDTFAVEYRDASHRYWLHKDRTRIPVPSATGVLKVLDKPALLKWYEDAGATGAAILAQQGELKDVLLSDVGDVVRLHGLGADAKKSQAADRGTLTHRVSEHWVKKGEAPDLARFNPEHRGYVEAMCSFLLEHKPKASSVERCVGSVKHLYAGRMDMRAVLADGRDCIVDFKTSPKARIYPEAHLQTQAYWMAEVECGHIPPDGAVIVALGEDGSYGMQECRARSGDWLAVLGCYRMMVELRASLKAAEKAAA